MKFDHEFESGPSAESFIKLTDGQSVEGVFRGNPVAFYQHWENKVPSICKGKGCPMCVAGNKPTFRFRLNFIVKQEDGSLIAKIFEQSRTVYETLKELSKSGYDLESLKVKIKRTGSGMSDTTYTILPVPKGELNEAALKAVSEVQLNNIDPTERIKPDEQFAEVPF